LDSGKEQQKKTVLGKKQQVKDLGRVDARGIDWVASL